MATTVTSLDLTDVPADFQSLYVSLQTDINEMAAAASAGWDKTRSPVAFSTGCILANCNQGTALADKGAAAKALAEIDALAAMGARAVTLPLHFPILYRPFYQFNGNPSDFPNILNFYQTVTSHIQKKGLKLIVESQILFQALGMKTQRFFATISPDQLLNARAVMIALIQQQFAPDFLNLGSEPDTAADLLGVPMPTPAEYSAQVAKLQSQISAITPITAKLGAGIGTWLGDKGKPYLRQLLTVGLDYIDLHLYQVNFGAGMALLDMADMVISGGLPVGIAQTWVNKSSDDELKAQIDPSVYFGRNPFDFWAPLDQSFLQTLVAIAYWKKFVYISPFWERYLFAYIPFSKDDSSDTVDAKAGSAFMSAMLAGKLSPSGSTYSNVIG